jgi:glutathione synthase/RimK-type ligase-like ATP-grasp enzyme
MIVCLYGKTAEAFVAPTLADLQRAGAARGAAINALSIETAVRGEREWQSVERLYTLPFDVPAHLPAALPPAPPLLVRALFPRAELINVPEVHELSWDKIAMARRLLDRGVPMPESLISNDPEEAREFVRRHGQAILKETRSCGGHGHVVVFADDGGTIGGEALGCRYAVDFETSGAGRSLVHGVLACPPPFYLQRMVTDVGRSGALEPAQILRAYVVDGQVTFWTERYRDRVRRPGDFIISAAFGAKYRFLREVSDAAQTVARRAAEVLGVRVGAVDLIRTGDEGPYVLEVDTDGYHMMIDRSFKRLPEYRDIYDFDRYIAELLVAPAAPVPRKRSPQRTQRPRRPHRPL